MFWLTIALIGTVTSCTHAFIAIGGARCRRSRHHSRTEINPLIWRHIAITANGRRGEIYQATKIIGADRIHRAHIGNPMCSAILGRREIALTTDASHKLFRRLSSFTKTVFSSTTQWSTTSGVKTTLESLPTVASRKRSIALRPPRSDGPRLRFPPYDVARSLTMARPSP